MHVRDCMFTRNSAGHGGAIYAAANSDVAIQNTVISRCSANYGSAVMAQVGSNLLVTNCTVTENVNNESSGDKGAFCIRGEAFVLNSIVWNNLGSKGPIPAANICVEMDGEVTVGHSCVQGWSSGENITDDPLLIDYLGHLRWDSPCIDVGDNNYASVILTDVEGRNRIDVVSGIVDMGAYEGALNVLVVGDYPQVSSTNTKLFVPQGDSASFPVKLAMAPTEPVNLTVVRKSGDVAQSVASGQILTFDADNYDQPQYVTIAVAEMGVDNAGSTLFEISAPDMLPRQVEAVYGKIRYVDNSVSASGDGRSWTNAYKYLQDVLTQINDDKEHTEIRIAQGVYKPDQNTANPTGDGDPEKSFELVNNLAIYGGFPTGGSTWVNRDIDSYTTTLSGDIGTVDVLGDNSYTVVVAANHTLLDGLMIIGGNADYLTGTDKNYSGGGIYNDGVDMVMHNCTFEDNHAQYGGAMYNVGRCHIVIDNCTFTDNEADVGSYSYGAAINSVHYSDMQGAGTSIIIKNCEFNSNNSDNNYGGVRILGAVVAKVTGCEFSQNSHNVTNGTGGLYFWGETGSILEVADCEFAENECALNIGGSEYFVASVKDCLFESNQDSAFKVSCEDNQYIKLTGCMFIDNTSTYGGAIYTQQVSSLIEQCHFEGNTVSERGGAIYIEGDYEDPSYPTIKNCSFYNNSCSGVQNGGAIYNDGSCLVMTNCAFYDNGSEAITVSLDNASDFVTLTNCVVWDSTGTTLDIDDSRVTITNCDLMGSFDQGVWQYANAVNNGGNICADPLFVDTTDPAGMDDEYFTTDDGLLLDSGSPCLGTGASGLNMGIYPGAVPPEDIAPTPNPSTWAADSLNNITDISIDVYATEAFDPSGVEYYFEESSGNPGGHDSGWITNQHLYLNPLQAETTYQFRVRARDAYGNMTNWSSVKYIQTAPGQPANPLAQTVSQTEITISWDDVSSTEQGFEIYGHKEGDSFALIATVGPNVTSYSHTNLESGTTYYYWVRTYRGGAISGYSWPIVYATTYTPGNGPAAPDDLACTNVTPTQINLSWDDNSTDETGFYVERRLGTESWGLIDTVGANTTTYADSGLTSSREYSYRVRAYNASGPSDYTNVLVVHTLPSQPVSLTATAVSYGQINLNWNDNAEGNVDHYEVYRSVNSDFSGSVCIDNYVLTSGHNDNTVVHSTTYYYKVMAVNIWDGESALSAIASATTAGPPETVPPSWSSGVWESGHEPTALDSYTVTMRVAEASDQSTPISYRFAVYESGTTPSEENYSAWFEDNDQPTVRSYTQAGLLPGVSYVCAVQAKDLFDNTTAWMGHTTLPLESLGDEPAGTAEAVSGEMGGDLALSVDPFTGSVGYSVPIAVPPARQGAEPKITLSYNSGGGNGWCGMGWGLSMGSIQRDGTDGVPVDWTGKTDSSQVNSYDDAKGFTVAFGAVNAHLLLMAVNGSVREYRAEVDRTFLKFELYENDNYWLVTDKSGNKYYFGQVAGRIWNDGTDSEQAGTVGACMENGDWTSGVLGSTYLWALAKIIDINGNTTYLDYDTTLDDGALYLQRVRYNGWTNPDTQAVSIDATHCAEFSLESRSDETFSYATGYRVETSHRLEQIEVKVLQAGTDSLVRRYHLDYIYSDVTGRSLLNEITVVGSDGTSELPPVTFSYHQLNSQTPSFGSLQPWGDIEWPSGWSSLNESGHWCSPGFSDQAGSNVSLVDMNRDGLPDRVIRNLDGYLPGSGDNKWYVQYNTGDPTDGGGFGSLVEYGPLYADAGYTNWPQWNNITGGANGLGYTDLMDINADGFIDRVMLSTFGNLFGPYYNNSSAGTVRNYLTVQYGTGEGFARTGAGPGGGTDYTVDTWGPIDSQYMIAHPYWNAARATDGNGDSMVMMMDMNGDGRADRVMRTALVADLEPDDIVINEIQTNDGSGNWYIELFNARPNNEAYDAEEDGYGLKFSDAFDASIYPIDDDISANGRLVVSNITGMTPTTPSGWVYLVKADGVTFVDAVAYVGLQSGSSYGRRIDGSVLFQDFSTPSINSSNSGCPIVLNEIMEHNQSYSGPTAFVELYNIGTASFTLNQSSNEYSIKIYNSSGTCLETWAIPSNKQINGNSHWVYEPSSSYFGNGSTGYTLKLIRTVNNIDYVIVNFRTF